MAAIEIHPCARVVSAVFGHLSRCPNRYAIQVCIQISEKCHLKNKKAAENFLRLLSIALSSSEKWLPSMQAGVRRRPVDITAGDGCGARRVVDLGVGVTHDREDRTYGAERSVSAGRPWRTIKIRALVDAPSVVAALCDQIYFFICIL